MPAAAILAHVVPLTGTTDTVVLQAALHPAVMLVAIVFGSLATLLYPLVRAWARRLEGGAKHAMPALSGIEDRLDRIERAVESIALEVERVSEGQRFVTKLLAEKASSQLPPARP